MQGQPKQWIRSAGETTFLTSRLITRLVKVSSTQILFSMIALRLIQSIYQVTAKIAHVSLFNNRWRTVRLTADKWSPNGNGKSITSLVTKKKQPRRNCQRLRSPTLKHEFNRCVKRLQIVLEKKKNTGNKFQNKLQSLLALILTTLCGIHLTVLKVRSFVTLHWVFTMVSGLEATTLLFNILTPNTGSSSRSWLIDPVENFVLFRFKLLRKSIAFDIIELKSSRYDMTMLHSILRPKACKRSNFGWLI